jgi:hypothetical protein
MATGPGVMGNIDHRQGAGLGCHPRPTRDCPPGAFAFGLEKGGCGHAGYTEMFQNCAVANLYGGAWKSGDGVCNQLLNDDFFYRRVARSGTNSMGKGRVGYAEIFRF